MLNGSAPLWSSARFLDNAHQKINFFVILFELNLHAIYGILVLYDNLVVILFFVGENHIPLTAYGNGKAY